MGGASDPRCDGEGAGGVKRFLLGALAAYLTAGYLFWHSMFRRWEMQP